MNKYKLKNDTEKLEVTITAYEVIEKQSRSPVTEGEFSKKRWEGKKVKIMLLELLNDLRKSKRTFRIQLLTLQQKCL